MCDERTNGSGRVSEEVEMKQYITPHKEFFNWIYDRLVYVHGEDPDYDYMHSLKERIDDLFGDEKTEER